MVKAKTLKYGLVCLGDIALNLNLRTVLFEIAFQVRVVIEANCVFFFVYRRHVFYLSELKENFAAKLDYL